MKSRKFAAAVAITASGALILSACAPGGDEDGGSEAGDAEVVEGGGTLTAYNCEPQHMVPGNTTETCGSWVLNHLFTGLVQADTETYEAIPGVAESWETEDNITWTFELGEDWTFHNGEEITAQTFVDTFNWVVDPDNAQQSANFFDGFLGYEEVVDGDADELEGVRAVDDYTLEIELTEPFSPLPDMLTYSAFFPMPDEAYEDIDAYEQAPVGNGRYQMDGEWERDVQIAVDRFEDYAGEEPGIPERIEWQIYADIETAYTDVQAGNLDILDSTPPNRLGQVESDFGDNHVAFDTGTVTYLGLPLYQEEFQDVDVRRALSMAIDREEIIENIFEGSQTQASSIIPTFLPEGREGICESCDFDPEAAADLYEEADGPSEMTIYFNSGAGHEEWTEAVANQWQQHLDIDSIQFESLDFAQYLDLQDEEEVTGPFRLGWTITYPNAQYALEPIYGTGQSSNYTGFSDEAFDQLITDANAADDSEAASELYQEAEDILIEEMPIIPMWFSSYTVVYTDRINGDSIQMGEGSTLTDLWQVEVVQE